MSTFYAEMVDVAIELIDEFGRPVTLLTPVKGAASSIDPRRNTQPPSRAPTIAAEVGFEAREIDGDLIRSTDRRYLFKPDVTPTPDDRIEDDDGEHAVIRVLREKQGPTVLLYEVHTGRR